MSLNQKQELFIKEYLIDLNATQAARRAGYSEKTAYSQGQRLLKDAEVATAVQKLMDERSKRLEITADSVLQELAKLGFGNMRNLVDNDGNLIPVQNLHPDVAATLQEVTHDTLDDAVVKRKYKMADKRSSLELLGKHLKLFTDKTEISNPDGTLQPTVIQFVGPDSDD